MSTADGELDEDAVWGAGSEGTASEPDLEEEQRGAGHDEGEDGGSGGRGGVDGSVGVVAVDSGAPLSVGALGRLPFSDAEAEAAVTGSSAGGDEADGEGGGLSRALGRDSAAEVARAPLAVPSPSRRRHTEAGKLPPALL